MSYASIKRNVLKVAQDAGAAAYPNEACGIVVADGKKQRVVQIENSATDPRNNFLMRQEAVEEARGAKEVVGVWHTHVDESPKPSPSDIAGCEASGVPWYIVSVRKMADETMDFSDVEVVKPSGAQVDYLDRPYVYGVHDCWTLVRDFYLREFGVELCNLGRTDGFIVDGKSVLDNRDIWEQEGFYKIQEHELQRGDIVLFGTDGTGCSNHVGVYTGDDLILHHAQDRLSCRDVYYGFWQKNAIHFLRNRNVG